MLKILPFHPGAPHRLPDPLAPTPVEVAECWKVDQALAPGMALAKNDWWLVNHGWLMFHDG